MSVSIFRKDFINLDRFEDFSDDNTLLKSLSNDLIDHGFVDVGPSITRIEISDQDLTRFIDEFIIYHYDTEQEVRGQGAWGIRPWNVHLSHEQSAITKTRWSPEGQHREIEIDDFYNDGHGTWNGITNTSTSSPASNYWGSTAHWKDGGAVDANGGNYAPDYNVGNQKTLSGDFGLNSQWHTYLSSEFPLSGDQAVGSGTQSFGLDYVSQWGNPDPDKPSKYIGNWIGPPLENLNGEIFVIDGEDGAFSMYELLSGSAPESFKLKHPSILPNKLYCDDGAGNFVSNNGINYAYDDGNPLWDSLSPGWVGQDYFGSNKIFGPNTELFSYLNPHPLAMVEGRNGRGEYRKGEGYTYNTHIGTANPPVLPSTGNTDPGGSLDWNPGYHSLGDVGRAVYNNEFSKIKSLICTGNRGVTMSPHTDGVNTKFQEVNKYKEETNTAGDISHVFYLMGEHQSNFFPAGTVEEVRQESLLQFGLIDLTGQEPGLQIGDIYVLNFVTKNLKLSTLTVPSIRYDRVHVRVTDSDTLNLTNTVITKVLNTRLCNIVDGWFRPTLSTDVQSSVLFTGNSPDYRLLGLGSYGQLDTWTKTGVVIPTTKSGFIAISFEYTTILGVTLPPDHIEVEIIEGDSVNTVLRKIHKQIIIHEFPLDVVVFVEIDDDDVIIKINKLMTLISIYNINLETFSSSVDLSVGTDRFNESIGGFNDSGIDRYIPIEQTIAPTDQLLTIADGFVNDISIKYGNDKVSNGSIVYWSGSTLSPTHVYEDGYVPSIRLGPFNVGMDDTGQEILIDHISGGDKFILIFSGLINEDADEPWKDDIGIDVSMTYVAANNMTILELLLSMKDFLLRDAYLSKYMDIVVYGNDLILSYNYVSSGYMVRSKRAPGDFGLLNIPSEYWDTDLGLNANTVDTYNLNQVSDGLTYTDGGVAGVPGATIFMTDRNYGDTILGFDFNAISAEDIDNIGTVGTVTEGYKHPDFSVSVNFLVRPLRNVESLYNELKELRVPFRNDTAKVHISFHYSNDLGTFANPPTLSQQIYYSPFETSIEHEARTFCPYPISYKQHILQGSSATRPDGPSCSFRNEFKGIHPWEQGNRLLYTKFNKYNGVCYFDTFTKISDFSIGPIVLETSSDNPIIGVGDRQYLRIRFDTANGEEVMDTSQYISRDKRSIDLNDQSGSKNRIQRSNTFSYLQVNIATQYQLKSDGSVTGITRTESDRPVNRIVRPSGYLAEIKPQYDMYSKSQGHLISPYVLRNVNDDQISNLININSGIVGYRGVQYTLDAKDLLKREYLFNMSTNPINNDIRKAPNYKFANMQDTSYLKKGVLEDNEFKYENSFLQGSSMELVNDHKYNTTESRMGKGWFKRDGKVSGDVSGQYPMNYQLTVLNHGFSLYMHDQNSTTQSDDFAWLVVQRHVDQTTGDPDWVSDTQPVHCIYMSSKLSTVWSNFQPFFNSNNIDVNSSLSENPIFSSEGEIETSYWIEVMSNPENEDINIDLQSRLKRFVVREIDTVKPWDKHVYAGINTIDSHSVINPLEQLSFNEFGKLIIHFPTRMANQRVIFGTSELDMVAFTDAGAVNEDSFISSTRYGTSKERFYKGGLSTRPFGNGMRILFLVSGYSVQSTVGFTIS
jgi:hypothetical protein